MGKVKAKVAAKEPTKSLKTIIKPKEKLQHPAGVIQSVAPSKAKLPALKRKQKSKKAPSKNLPTAAIPKPLIVKGKPHTKKNEKIADKRRSLMQKFELMAKEELEEKRQRKVAKANKKIGTVATMGALKDALPSLEALTQLKGNEMKTGIPAYEAIKVGGGKAMLEKQKGGGGVATAKSKSKISKREAKEKRIASKNDEIGKRYDYLQRLMNDKTFRKNPREVIAAHIKNTKLLEENGAQT